VFLWLTWFVVASKSTVKVPNQKVTICPTTSTSLQRWARAILCDSFHDSLRTKQHHFTLSCAWPCRFWSLTRLLWNQTLKNIYISLPVLCVHAYKWRKWLCNKAIVLLKIAWTVCMEAGRACFVNPRWLGAWTDAWVSDYSAYIYWGSLWGLMLCGLEHAPAATKVT